MWGPALTFLGEKPSWLMVLPWHYQITTRGFSGFQVHLPETPELLTSQWGRWSGSDSWSPSYFSLDVGLVEMTKPGSPPQESLHVWFVAFLTPIGKTKEPHTLFPPLIGLIQTKLQQAFVGFFVVFFLFILHNHALNLNL